MSQYSKMDAQGALDSEVVATEAQPDKEEQSQKDVSTLKSSAGSEAMEDAPSLISEAEKPNGSDIGSQTQPLECNEKAVAVDVTSGLSNQLNPKMEDHSSPSLKEPADSKKYEKRPWKDLPIEVQDAAKRLGYTKVIWNENEDSESSKKFWEELSTEEREDVTTLGYNEKTWNFGDKEITPDDYDDMFWTQLPKNIRKAHRVLGLNEDIWDKGESAAVFDKDWDQLTAAELKAASIIGYTAKTWDEVPEEDSERQKPSEIYTFFKGSSYICLDSLAMSAFFGVIESVFHVGKIFLNDSSLNALKIILGLAVMQYNGQFKRRFKADTDRKKARSRKKKKEAENLLSFMNIFSWWTTYAGVNYFFYTFEKDVLYHHADVWYVKLYGMAEEAFEAEYGVAAGAENMTAGAEDMTCSYVQNFDYNNSVQGFLVGQFCEATDNQWYTYTLGNIYYYTVFVVSALSMWLVFDDNFLKGCDV